MPRLLSPKVPPGCENGAGWRGGGKMLWLVGHSAAQPSMVWTLEVVLTFRFVLLFLLA